MLESILITTGPIAAALVILAVLRFRRLMSSKAKVVAEHQLADEEDETDVSDEEAERDVSDEEAEQAQRIWRRSYSK